MTSAPGSQPGANAMAGSHSNAAYLSGQAAVAAALKQQQILEQQKQQQYMQRQQLMAEQVSSHVEQLQTRPLDEACSEPGGWVQTYRL